MDIAKIISLPEITKEDIIRIKRVIDLMEDGETTVKQALDQVGIRRATFYSAIHTCDELDSLYQKAQKARAEAFVEDIVEISDTEADPMRARIRIDTRRWYASKMKPGKYADKLDINITQTVNLNAALDDARSRIISIPVSDYKTLENIAAIENQDDVDIFS